MMQNLKRNALSTTSHTEHHLHTVVHCFYQEGEKPTPAHVDTRIPGRNLHMAFISPLSTSLRTASGPAITPRRPWRMTATPPEETTSATNTPTPTSGSQLDEGYELDTEALKEKALAVVSDVGERPLYYGKIVGYVVGALVTITVLRAVVSAVDSIPVLPGALELIGLGYTAWFVWRYILFKESREELVEEIEEFLGRARPGQ